MIRRTILSVCLAAVLLSGSAFAQVGVRPRLARVGPGNRAGAWAEVPDTFKSTKIPQWPLPTDLKRWETTDRAKTRATLLQCLGELPERPDPRKVRVLSRVDKGEYILEHFEFHNGVDMIVPGL